MSDSEGETSGKALEWDGNHLLVSRGGPMTYRVATVDDVSAVLLADPEARMAVLGAMPEFVDAQTAAATRLVSVAHLEEAAELLRRTDWKDYDAAMHDWWKRDQALSAPTAESGKPDGWHCYWPRCQNRAMKDMLCYDHQPERSPEPAPVAEAPERDPHHHGMGAGDEDGYNMLLSVGGGTHRDVRNYLHRLSPDYLGKPITETLLAYVDKAEQLEREVVELRKGLETQATLAEEARVELARVNKCRAAEQHALRRRLYNQKMSLRELHAALNGERRIAASYTKQRQAVNELLGIHKDVSNPDHVGAIESIVTRHREVIDQMHALRTDSDSLRAKLSESERKLGEIRDWKLNVEAALRAGYGGNEAKAQADAGLYGLGGVEPAAKEPTGGEPAKQWDDECKDCGKTESECACDDEHLSGTGTAFCGSCHKLNCVCPPPAAEAEPRFLSSTASSATHADIEADMAKTDCSVSGCGDLARTYGLCFAHARAAGRDAALAGFPADPAPPRPGSLLSDARGFLNLCGPDEPGHEEALRKALECVIDALEREGTEKHG